MPHDVDSWTWDKSSPDEHLRNGLRSQWPVLYWLMRLDGPILEVGCGSGKISVLAKLLCPKKRVVALDLAQGAVNHTQMLASHAGVNIEVWTADALALPYHDQEFGAAFSVGMVEHYPNEWIVQALEEQCRVAEAVLVSVPLPTYLYTHASHGDERALNKTEWLDIFSRVAAIADVTLLGPPTEEYWLQVILDSRYRKKKE